jgi:hypothetical protein
VRTAQAAVSAARRDEFDVAVVDLSVKGGGVALARRLARRVPRVYLSVGARLLADELVEAAIGFPVVRKRDLPDLVTRGSSHPRPSDKGKQHCVKGNRLRAERD